MIKNILAFFSLGLLTATSFALTERVTLPLKETFNAREIEWFNTDGAASITGNAKLCGYCDRPDRPTPSLLYDIGNVLMDYPQR